MLPKVVTFSMYITVVGRPQPATGYPSSHLLTPHQWEGAENQRIKARNWWVKIMTVNKSEAVCTSKSK